MSARELASVDGLITPTTDAVLPLPDDGLHVAMAKLNAPEEAQKVIDASVQMHGGLGVTKGAKVEELYREIRALRIYEGASEVQKMIIARDLLKERSQ